MLKRSLLIGIAVVSILVAGCLQSSPSPAQPATVTTTSPPTIPTGGQNPQVSVSPGSVAVPVVTPLVIPATGVFVYVNYLGSFSGSYGAPVNLLQVRDSGERLYPVEGLNGTVSAGFAKLDGSNHPITVKIYGSGELLKSATSSSPFGMVNITANP